VVEKTLIIEKVLNEIEICAIFVMKYEKRYK
jgi:hypothetical protein